MDIAELSKRRDFVIHKTFYRNNSKFIFSKPVNRSQFGTTKKQVFYNWDKWKINGCQCLNAWEHWAVCSSSFFCPFHQCTLCFNASIFTCDMFVYRYVHALMPPAYSLSFVCN